MHHTQTHTHTHRHTHTQTHTHRHTHTDTHTHTHTHTQTHTHTHILKPHGVSRWEPGSLVMAASLDDPSKLPTSSGKCMARQSPHFLTEPIRPVPLAIFKRAAINYVAGLVPAACVLRCVCACAFNGHCVVGRDAAAPIHRPAFGSAMRDASRVTPAALPALQTLENSNKYFLSASS